MKYYLASACLLGIKSRYDGKDALNHSLRRSLRNKPVLIICPEKLGGLPTPRLPAQIIPRGARNGRKWIDAERHGAVAPAVDGADVLKGNARVHNGINDVTAGFVRGAKRVQDLIGAIMIPRAYLKSHSPSCGYGRVYCRLKRNNPQLVNGDGVLASVLRNKKVAVKSL
jgi:uncharacterized protein YbbK (DUF523 family)